MKNSLAFLFLFVLLFPGSLLAERPNVVLIISDDHAWTDYGFLGNEKIQSPHIDKLAAEGLTFTRGYVTTALCSPSLATMLTGLYTHQHGITGNDPVRGKDREAWLDRFFENPMLPKLLANAGYNTLHTGSFDEYYPSKTQDLPSFEGLKFASKLPMNEWGRMDWGPCLEVMEELRKEIPTHHEPSGVTYVVPKRKRRAR